MTHSPRTALTRLRKRGIVLTSSKRDGATRYRICDTGDTA